MNHKGQSLLKGVRVNGHLQLLNHQVILPGPAFYRLVSSAVVHILTLKLDRGPVWLNMVLVVHLLRPQLGPPVSSKVLKTSRPARELTEMIHSLVLLMYLVNYIQVSLMAWSSSPVYHIGPQSGLRPLWFGIGSQTNWITIRYGPVIERPGT